MSGPVTDIHVHVQPWDMIRPPVLAAMRKGRDDLAEIERCFADPNALLAHMDRQGVGRMVLINYESPDPSCDLDCVPNTARRMPIRAALNNSFGFGGTNGALLFKRFEG